MEWISVKDRLPEEGVEVIIWGQYFTPIQAYLRKGKWKGSYDVIDSMRDCYVNDSHISNSELVTHWMPYLLPLNKATIKN